MATIFSVFRRSVLAVLAAAMGLAVGAGGAAAAEALRIGVPTNLTGAAGSIGKDTVEALEYWGERINAQGGLLGRKVEFVVRDTQG